MKRNSLWPAELHHAAAGSSNKLRIELSEFNLVEYFKKNPKLVTDLGVFEYKALIGQGGNAQVLQFYKEPVSFAVKFLEHQDAKKLSRLKDEFFSAAQLSSHTNVARNYHFDQVQLGERTFSLIIMKLYGESLKKLGSLPANLPEEERSKKAVKLFSDLLKGLNHLHEGRVIHRDLKPENVFYDGAADAFVIGDLGIAHFSEEFPKEAETKGGERLGNYLFSPKEQANAHSKPAPANDLFSLAQVIQWFMTGATHRGVGRKRFTTSESSADLRVLDTIVEACLQDDIAARLQSVNDVKSAITLARTPTRDITLRCEDLDKAICMSYEQIEKIWFSTRQQDIENFLSNFSRECRSDEFSTVYANGGDHADTKFEQLKDRRWLLNGIDELLVENVIAYRHYGRNYKSFFIVLAGPDDPFEWTNADGITIHRKRPNTEFTDSATLFDGRYMDSVIQNRRYFKEDGQTIEVTSDRFLLRQRNLKRTAYLIVPNGSAASCMSDRTPMENLLHSVATTSRLEEQVLSEYLKATNAHHSYELTKWD